MSLSHAYSINSSQSDEVLSDLSAQINRLKNRAQKDTGPKGEIGAAGPQGNTGLAGNLALAGQVCPGTSLLKGFRRFSRVLAKPRV